MAERLWTMKILAGVHAGAEVALSDEEATLGRDDACDFVLEDAGLADRHLRLYAGTGVRMTVLDGSGPVCVDGRPVEGSVELAPYQVVTVGGLALALGPADQAWPPIDLPASPSPESRSAQEEVAAREEPADGPIEESPATEGPPATDTGESAGAHEEARRSISRHVRTAGMVVVALLAVAAAVWLLAPRQVQPEHADPEETARKIEEIASRYGAVVHMETDTGTDGSITVTGNVDTSQNRLQLLDELAKANVHATVHIVSTDEIAESVATILDRTLNADERNLVTVRPVENSPGELTVVGYVEQESSLSEIKSTIERDVKEYMALHYKVQTRADRLSILRKRLDDLDLGTRMRIQELPRGVGLFGPVRTAEDLTRIVELADDFNEEFDSRPMLKLSGTDSFLGESTIDLDVRAVVLGESNHVILHDGESYRAGSKVADRYVVKTITERYMILEKTTQLTGDGTTGGPDIVYFIFSGA